VCALRSAEILVKKIMIYVPITWLKLQILLGICPATSSCMLSIAYVADVNDRVGVVCVLRINKHGGIAKEV